MCSRLVFRSIQHPVRSLFFNRFLSLSQVQLTAVTKLKEKSSSNVETSSNERLSTDKTVIPPSTTTTTNVSDINKTYSEKIHRIVDEISKLSLVEVMDLNELLKVNLFRNIYFIIGNRVFFCFSIENAQDTRRADCGIGRRQCFTTTGRTGTSNYLYE